MLEKEVEKCLVDGIKGIGGMCLKFVSPSTVGVPDRIAIIPPGRVVFVELKTKTGRLSKMQQYVIREMRVRGAHVEVLKGIDEVKAFLNEVRCLAGKEYPECTEEHGKW